MLLGIGFVTVITASITSSFVRGARGRRRSDGAADDRRTNSQEINARLERIETALNARP